eukprot:9303767-Pyramimonas_sp.AAC.1
MLKHHHPVPLFVDPASGAGVVTVNPLAEQKLHFLGVPAAVDVIVPERQHVHPPHRGSLPLHCPHE